VVPTDTVNPFPDFTPIVMPTVPPVDENTPTPLADVSGQLVLDDSSFSGGFTQANGYHGRTAQWVYGQGTDYHTMTARFTIEKKPKAGNVSVLGIDSEDEPKTMMRVTLNDYVLYEGPDPLPNDTPSGPGGPGNWGWVGWQVPNKVLREGENVLAITHLDPSDKTNYPIFIMVDQVVVDW
jgi:hypothetical protein